MAIIVPHRYSTFGDSTSTEGPSRKYVLAQFRSDAELDWIAQLRTALATTEVKYKHFLDQRARLRENRDLWTQIERGVTGATIIVTDPEPVMANVRRALVADGAEFDRDFDESVLQSHTATALIGGTPIAYIPEELMAKLAWARGERLVGLRSLRDSEANRVVIAQSIGFCRPRPCDLRHRCNRPHAAVHHRSISLPAVDRHLCRTPVDRARV